MFNPKNLYRNLLTLAEDEDLPFYMIEHEGPFDGATYHVFSYHVASYTDFLCPDALECRGHMFRIEDNNAKLVSLPFPKFFNRNENPFTMNLNFHSDNIEYIATKEDGSLISTYKDAHGDLRLKSKTSLTSTMAMESMKLLYTNNFPLHSASLIHFCKWLEDEDYTVIMEYVSPQNRIVLPYEQSNLVVLGVRSKETGEYLSYEDMCSLGLDKYAAKNILNTPIHDDDIPTFVDSIPKMKGIEGYVIRFKDGTMVKCKTDEYVSLHHAKDSVTSPRRLMEVVLQEASDDLRQMFTGDEQALNEIDNMERFVIDTVNQLIKPVDRFYAENKNLERKYFAIKGQKELRRDQFTFAMAKYSGKDIDYKSYMIKNYKEYLKNYQTTLMNIDD